MKIRILDIDWDLYDENSGETLTPKQAGVPKYIDIEVPDSKDVNKAAEEYMDKYFNWRYRSFSLEAHPKGWGRKPHTEKKSGKKKSKASAVKKAKQKREKIIEEVLDKVRDACQYAMDNLVMRDSELEEIECLLRQNLK